MISKIQSRAGVDGVGATDPGQERKGVDASDLRRRDISEVFHESMY